MNVSSLDDLQPTNLLLDCPDCGRDHEWTPIEAVLSAFPKAQIKDIRTAADIAAEAQTEALPEVEDEWDPFEED